jgi:hypothetical protein
VTLSIPGVWELLRRNGWSRPQPTQWMTERGEDAVATSVKEV